MKSFEDIHILRKVKLFCLKNLFFGKSFYLKKKDFKNKKNALEKKIKYTVVWKKLLKKKLCV